MLDLFTIFSKGGIVLWYFQGTADLFTNSVNELIKSVILQERGLTTAWNHNTLSLQYKLDNEFELVFVVAYQNIIKLSYIDKFLNDIQLRFRDKYKNIIQSGQLSHDFSSFREDFNDVLRECEEEERLLKQTPQKPRSYNESEKSTRTVASMIENKQGGFLSSLVSSAISPSSNEKENKTAAKAGNSKNANSTSDNDDIDSGCEANSDSGSLPVGLGENKIVKGPGGKPRKFENKKYVHLIS